MIKKTFLVLAVLAVTFGFTMANKPLWLRYPAISPDGNTVVFSYKGNLFKVDTKGGVAKSLTINEYYNYNPVWSPDGKYIAFNSDRNGNMDIFIMPVQGGNPKRITTNSTRETVYSFTPDGKYIIYGASIMKDAKYAGFPRYTELYKVPVDGGRPEQLLSSPAEYAQFTKDMKQVVYQDRKGGENNWRKHHTSSITRDIRVWDVKTNTHRKITTFKGEDRNPVLASNQNDIYYLSEQDGNFNLYKTTVNASGKGTKLTSFEKNPVRFLSVSDNNTACFTYDGEIYTMKEGATPVKLDIDITIDNNRNAIKFNTYRSSASEMVPSPNGKEVALIIRGEVYVTSMDYSTTKQITNTPTQERSVQWSPDSKTLVYAGERDGSWNIYTAKVVRKEEKGFANSTLIKEEVLVNNGNETFQPTFSPNGKEVAFLENRTTLKVINLKDKKERVILPAKWNYSYTDGDQSYSWSPDSKWFLVSYIAKNRWPNSDIALVDAQGNQNITNLTKSGYIDDAPRWMMNGEMIIWGTDRNGMRSHGSWGSQNDVYALFLTKEAYNKFRMTKEEFEEYKELQKLNKKDKKDSKKDKKKKNKKDEAKKKSKDIKIDLNDLDERIVRLTGNSSSLSDAVVDSKGEKLYYMSRFEKGFDLWVKDLRKNSTRLLAKLNGYGGGLKFINKGKDLFFYSGGMAYKYSVMSKKRKPVTYSAPFNLNYPEEKAYLYEHVWRQAREKFYKKDMHGVDWNYYKDVYKKFLPHINNNYDYSELLSELLGELNASHTGSGYRHYNSKGDRTAVLGAFYSNSHKGDGLLIDEIIKLGPLYKAGIKAGSVIKEIDGVKIKAGEDYFPLLNRKSGKRTLLKIYDSELKKDRTIVVKPVSSWAVSGKLYDRWIENRRAEVEKVSGGRLGYVHIRGMNDASFRNVYSDLFGRYNDKDAIVIDTRYNGGGHLHEDVEVLFSGKKYLTLIPRGQEISEHPRKRWKKPSIMIIGEANYSNAHGTPWVYKTMNIGKLVGMPVPGTMTSVWWETLMDRSLYFGIPQIGYIDKNGNYLENQQLEPDYKVENDVNILEKGEDQQIKRAVEELLKSL